MIRTHPFSTWPLHVKLFTEEVVQYWNTLAFSSPLLSAYQQHNHCHNSDDNNPASGDEFTKGKQHPNQGLYELLFPPGFTCSVELEGVDGASGIQGSGRRGPLCITDGKCCVFMTSVLESSKFHCSGYDWFPSVII
jgi:hypothetical protein